jgi:hypothetical protein
MLIRSVALPPLQRLRAALRARLAPHYTAAEVAAALDPKPAGALEPERRAVILACAARPSEWLDYLDPRLSWELGRAADRLPSLVFWHRHNESLEAIGRRLRLLGGAYQIERALGVAAACIAARLNDRDRPTIDGFA